MTRSLNLKLNLKSSCLLIFEFVSYNFSQTFSKSEAEFKLFFEENSYNWWNPLVLKTKFIFTGRSIC